MATIAPADSKIGQQIARITNAKRALADYLKDNTDLATENMSINELVEAILALIGQKGAYNIVQNLLDDGNSELVITDASGSNANELDSFITREISGVYTNDRITKVGLYGLGGCENLTSINLPNVVTVGDSGFYNCKLLKSVNLPKLTSLGNNGFNNTGLESINLPLCNKIGSSSFSYTKQLVSVILPLAASIPGFVLTILLFKNRYLVGCFYCSVCTWKCTAVRHFNFKKFKCMQTCKFYQYFYKYKNRCWYWLHLCSR